MGDARAWLAFTVVWALICGGAIGADPVQTWRVMAGKFFGMTLTMTVVSMCRAAEQQKEDDGE